MECIKGNVLEILTGSVSSGGTVSSTVFVIHENIFDRQLQ